MILHLPQLLNADEVRTARALLGAVRELQAGHAVAFTPDGRTLAVGCVDRLVRLGYVETAADPADRRRLTVSLADAGRRVFDDGVATALKVSAETLGPLTQAERAQLMALLLKLV